MPVWLIGSELFFFSLILSLILVPAAKKVALRRGITDKPGERKMHHQPKALMGGLAIFTAFLITLAFHFAAFSLRNHLPFLGTALQPHLSMISAFPGASRRLLFFLAGAFLIVLLGFWDDKYGTKFPVKIKFLGQFAAAAIAVSGGIVTNFMPGNFLDYVLTLFWIVGITNSFNLLDNMDGLSAGVAVIAGILLFIITIFQGQVFTAFILAIFVGSVGGFLPYNLYPSKLFMGDAGSMFLGFFLGSVTVNSSYVTAASPTYVPVIIPLIILAVPLFDTFSVMLIRRRRGKPLFVGDKNHFSHRLVQLGMRQSEAVTFIYVVTLTVGLMALLLPGAEAWESIVILLQTILIFVIIAFIMFVTGHRKQEKK